MSDALRWFAIGTFGLLAVATVAGIVGFALARSDKARAVAADANSRIRAWWWLAGCMIGAAWLGRPALVPLFALASFMALREFISLHRTRRGDHRALFLAFFVVLPLQYVFVALPWYGMFAVFVPVYAFLLLTARAAVAGDTTRFLERTAKVQFGLLICVYALSHVPAILLLPGDERANVALLCWFLAVVQLSDVFQWVWGKALGRAKLAPTVSPNKTWGGLIGGLATATAVGAALWWMTPFSPGRAAAFAAGCCFMGVLGGLVMSAIKRDAGAKDWGTSLGGHGGVLDRVDGLAFAAPVFFHVARWVLGQGL
ncbi:MAG: phosphatidate cytidylyltransferase [Planctomycetes bacterium]|nr:phosphatidate cytidylyltransferase [Planctomycetota bacterium]